MLELGDLFRHVFPDQGRVVPLEGPLERGGYHVLSDVVHGLGHGVLLGVLLRPESRPLFVDDATHQHGVRGGEALPDRLPHLVVEVRELPLIRSLHHAVQRHELRSNYLPHFHPPSFGPAARPAVGLVDGVHSDDGRIRHVHDVHNRGSAMLQVGDSVREGRRSDLANYRGLCRLLGETEHAYR